MRDERQLKVNNLRASHTAIKSHKFGFVAFDIPEHLYGQVAIPKNLENWHNNNLNGNSSMNKENKFALGQSESMVGKTIRSANEINKIRAANIKNFENSVKVRPSPSGKLVQSSTDLSKNLDCVSNISRQINDVGDFSIGNYDPDIFSNSFSLAKPFTDMNS